MASSVSATNARLSVDDWVQEGFRVLAEDGGIGFLHLSGSRPSPLAAGRREDFLEVMLRH